MRRLLLFTMLLSAGLTALIGLNGAVAALLPMTIVMAMRRSLQPSRLLMPLAFAGSAGSLLLLTGSPVNVVISDAANNAGVGAFGFAEFAIVGVPVVIGTLAIVLLFGDRLVPQRTSEVLPPDLSEHARTLVEHYSIENVVHERVTDDSDLIGQPRIGVDLTGYPGVSVITVADDWVGPRPKVPSRPAIVSPCSATWTSPSSSPSTMDWTSRRCARRRTSPRD